MGGNDTRNRLVWVFAALRRNPNGLSLSDLQEAVALYELDAVKDGTLSLDAMYPFVDGRDSVYSHELLRDITEMMVDGLAELKPSPRGPLVTLTDVGEGKAKDFEDPVQAGKRSAVGCANNNKAMAALAMAPDVRRDIADILSPRRLRVMGGRSELANIRAGD